MGLLTDSEAWIAFATLAALEVVLGVDNLLYLSVLLARLPPARRRAARSLGLAFAMVTRIGLLAAVVWTASRETVIGHPWGFALSIRAVILCAGGAFLAVQSVLEIVEQVRARTRARPTRSGERLWPTILNIGIADVAFSLDSVFTAVGLTRHFAVMVAAIVVSMLAMMVISGAFIRFIERNAGLRMLALCFLVLIGADLVGTAFGREIPAAYLYSALGFGFIVESLNRLAAARTDRGGGGQ